MKTESQPKVLCVDDEPNVLDGIKRHLRRHFDVKTAGGGVEGLRSIQEEGPFAVVVSDLRMPRMDGIEFLSKVNECAPDTTRILLTGDADLTAAIAAVNEGNIFRFLTKPCPSASLIAQVEAGAEQHRLVTAEKVLLEQTLHGSVKMLTEALALANPQAFGRANRVKKRAGELADQLGAPERWKMDMAAMLSQVACVTVPSEVLEHFYAGDELSASEQAIVDRLPEIAEALLVDIPRIDDVRAILRYQNEPFAGGTHKEELVPVGARILKTVLDCDLLETQGIPPEAALDVLRSRTGIYDPEILMALGTAEPANQVEEEIRDVSIQSLTTGMVLLDPVESVDGRLLVAHGQEVSAGVVERLRNFSQNLEIKEPLRVLVRHSGDALAKGSAGS